MKLSTITPTHDPSHLLELYQSFNVQEYKNWEWIIYTNGPGTKLIQDRKFDQLRNDPKIKIIKSTSRSSKVGYLKHMAFKAGTGEILVEVDHDDVLDGRCFKVLAGIFTNEPEIGFAYSSDWRFRQDGKHPGSFGATWGWKENVTVDWRDRICVAHKAFAPSANAFSKIFYAPDHVRAWRKDVYDKLGGHNKTYSVLDDLELMMKTYLETKVAFVQAPLYYYRITGDNTWLKRQEQIASLGVKLSRKYLLLLATRDADLRALKKVYLGPEKNMPDGFIRYDVGLYNNDEIGIIYVHKAASEINLAEAYHHLSDFGWVIFEGGDISQDMIKAAVPGDNIPSAYQYQVFHKQYTKDPFVALSVVKNKKVPRPHHKQYSIKSEGNRAA